MAPSAGADKADAEDPDAEDADPIAKLRDVRNAADLLLTYLDHKDCPEAMFCPELYDKLRLMWEKVIQPA